MRNFSAILSSRSHVNNQRGQATVEAVLILTVILIVLGLISSEFREQSLLSKAAQGPWTYLAGMIEGGVWVPEDRVREYHPNQFERVRTINPESVD